MGATLMTMWNQIISINLYYKFKPIIFIEIDICICLETNEISLVCVCMCVHTHICYHAHGWDLLSIWITPKRKTKKKVRHYGLNH